MVPRSSRHHHSSPSRPLGLLKPLMQWAVLLFNFTGISCVCRNLATYASSILSNLRKTVTRLPPTEFADIPLPKAFIDPTSMAPESCLSLAYGQPDSVRWEAKPPTLWTCDVCSAVFQRVDHLKRHSATHKTDKPFSCDFCGCVYKRGDVLRRHWKSCSVRIRTGKAIPEPQSGGKQKYACDGCARSKRLCSGGQLCLECHWRGRICSYNRLRDTTTTTATEQSEMWNFPRVEGSAVSHEMSQLPDYAALDRRPTSESRGSTWNLGAQNFYASADVCYKAYGRLR
ncbi:hypothetical protein BDW75DRAFT_189570 [Aspergillus navahoensis]